MRSPSLESRADPPAWQGLMDSVPFPVAVVSPEARIVFVNRWLGGRSHESLAGQPIDLAAPGMGAKLEPILTRVLAGGPTEQFELPIAGRQGLTAWFRFHVTRLQAAEWGGDGALVVGQDVTESKQAGIELRMSVNALHRLIEAREQLSADLHDGILQSLYGVGLRLEAVRAGLRKSAPEVAAQLGRAVAELNDTMKEIRRFIAGGQGPLPTTVNWEEALAGMLRGLEVEGGPSIEVLIQPEAAGRIEAAHRGELLLIAREAVSNATRHAGASRIWVRLLVEGRMTRLEIEDDGRGFEPGRSVDRSGLGLLTMTRRAAGIGATLTIRSASETGTLVRVDLERQEP